MTNSICYSGGAKPFRGFASADLIFGECAEKVGHTVIHYTFKNHRDFKQNISYIMLSQAELNQADTYIHECNMVLNRTFPAMSEHTNNLLRRNWWQIKDVGTVYAVPECIDDKGIVSGGTAWAVHMAILGCRRGIFVYDQSLERWFKWDYTKSNWIACIPPKPEGQYAGIGTRRLKPIGVNAIKELYSLVPAVTA